MTYDISQLFYALETGFLNLSGGVPDAIDASDVHQTFNPTHGNISIPKPKKKTKVQYHSQSLNPDPALSYTEDWIPGSGAFPGEPMSYRDPFFLCCAFPKKTVTGTWAGGAATYGKITADFTAQTNRSSIMIQAGISDGTSPIARCYNGIVLTRYDLGFKKGGVLIENSELSVAYYEPNTQAFIPNGSFDDGLYSLWALAGATQKLYHASGISLFWDESHAAELAGLKIEECMFSIIVPQELEADSSAIYHQHEWAKNRDFQAKIVGILTGDTEYLEVEKLFKNKVKKDLRMEWDSTADEKKWLQLDDCWIEEKGSELLPAKTNKRRLELLFKGPTMQFEGNYENIADPTTRIDNT